MDGIHISRSTVKNATHCHSYELNSDGTIKDDKCIQSHVRVVFSGEVIIFSNPDMLCTLYDGWVYIYHNNEDKGISFIPECNQLLALHSF